jgi:hypothetical protein
MITNISTKNVSVIAVEKDSPEMDNLDVATSTAMSLPKGKFTIPAKGKIDWCKFEFPNLKDDNGNARVALGIGVLDKDGKVVPVSIGSLTRAHLLELPVKGEDGQFILRGKQRKSVLANLQEISAMNYKPSELVEEFLAGKTFTETEQKQVFTPRYGDDHKVKSFDKVSKGFYVASDTVVENPNPEQTQTN